MMKAAARPRIIFQLYPPSASSPASSATTASSVASWAVGFCLVHGYGHGRGIHVHFLGKLLGRHFELDRGELGFRHDQDAELTAPRDIFYVDRLPVEVDLESRRRCHESGGPPRAVPILIPEQHRRESLPVHSRVEMRVQNPFALDDVETRVPDAGIRESCLFVERDVVARDLLRDRRGR